jgi:hypothetical protein
VQTAACHNVGLAAENFGSAILHVHRLEQAELAALVVEKQIDVEILAGIAARGRAE